MKLTMLTIIPGVLFRTIYVPQPLFEYDRKLNKERLRLKKDMGLKYTEDHHLIPKCLKKHPVLYDLNINHCKNLKIMPTKNYPAPHWIRNHQSHPAYNAYVKKMLNTIPVYTQEERKYQIYLLIYYLDSHLNYKDDIPF
jgi:hypothetical protein